MPFNSRRGARIRTGDPLLPKQSRKHANHGKKPSNSLMDCTICRSCRFDVRHPVGFQQRENSGNCRNYCGSFVNAKAPATVGARAEGYRCAGFLYSSAKRHLISADSSSSLLDGRRHTAH